MGEDERMDELSDEARAQIERDLRQATMRAAAARARELNPTEKERAMDEALKAFGLKRTSDK